MRRSIVIGIGTGVTVALAWALYAILTGPENNIAANPALWFAARVTCPLVAAGTWLHSGVRLEWVVVSNAAVYGLLGASIGWLRREVVKLPA